MKVSPQFTGFRFPRGAYWICDPSYAWPGTEDQLRPVWEQVRNGLPAMIDAEDDQIFMWFTAFGDGIYFVAGPKCGQVGVDSGTLAIIPNELVLKWGAGQKMKDLEERGLVVSIRTARAFTITEEDGNIFFLDYCVDTSGFLDEDDGDGG